MWKRRWAGSIATAIVVYGVILYNSLVQVKHNGGPFGLVRRTGFHLALASRDTRLIRDYDESLAEMAEELGS